jgi:DNA-binding NarL/FixJ family response regulator
MNNLLIVEDHALTRFALKTAFEACEYKVFEAENANLAFECIKNNKIDVILMDLGLPDVNGIEATRKIKQKYVNIKIVILTSHEKKEEVLDSLKAGANAYCSKDINPDKLTEVVKSVVDGDAWFDAKVAQIVLEAASSGHKIQNYDINSETNLTNREKQVLALIVEGYNNNDIAGKLDVSINTTKAHVCNILQKLSVQDRTQAAIKAIKDRII